MAEHIRIRGVVQGVGFRPTVARLARQRGLSGFVRNDAEGVLVGLRAPKAEVDDFVQELLGSLPPLARVTEVERFSGVEGHEEEALMLENQEEPASQAGVEVGAFIIEASLEGDGAPEVPPDAATCPDCLAEVFDPLQRRFRYPFATCTQCGPRYTIAVQTPFDRENTTMAGFALCAECRAEYEDDTDRRFHAQAVACHRCGPKAWLERADGRAFSVERFTMLDPVDAVASLLHQGEIVAVKGVGGYHLCCDATSLEAVQRLRKRKHRGDKPFALMVRDLGVAETVAHISEAERKLLESPEGPIVMLRPTSEGEWMLGHVAPGQGRLGIMLPSTPLHHLMLRRVSKPVVCTSGNMSDAPPCIDPEEARTRLGGMVEWFLHHDRPIRHRADDSLARVRKNQVEILRRARGLAPERLAWPPGLSPGLPTWSAGAQLKSTFALSDDMGVWVSPHLGDLDHPEAVQAYGHAHRLLRDLRHHEARQVAVDFHPEYRSTQLARDAGLPVVEVQHHHAHVAAVMLEHGLAHCERPVLGIALDGLGMGPDGRLWGGEFLAVRYDHFVRLATFKPVALLGGDAAAREPWRNLLAHLRAEQSFRELQVHHGDVPAVQKLLALPTPTFDAMLAAGSKRAPRASSCGRLFDAVAAAVGLRWERLEWEGQAAMELEALAEPFLEAVQQEGDRYPIGFPLLPQEEATAMDAPGRIPYLEFLGMWSAILGDLAADAEPGRIAARFHVALAEALVRMVGQLRGKMDFSGVVLSGGCFQNEILTNLTEAGLRKQGYQVWSARQLPAHDGGISVGQAAVAAARSKEL